MHRLNEFHPKQVLCQCHLQQALPSLKKKESWRVSLAPIGIPVLLQHNKQQNIQLAPALADLDQGKTPVPIKFIVTLGNWPQATCRGVDSGCRCTRQVNRGYWNMCELTVLIINVCQALDIACIKDGKQGTKSILYVCLHLCFMPVISHQIDVTFSSSDNTPLVLF